MVIFIFTLWHVTNLSLSLRIPFKSFNPVLLNVPSSDRTINKLLLSELPQFNGLALQIIWSLLGTISCLHRDLASDMEQLFHSFTQQVH